MGGGGARENRQAVSAGKICYRRGNAMWQLSMATAGGSGLKFAFAAFRFFRIAAHVCACVCVCVSITPPCIWRGESHITSADVQILSFSSLAEHKTGLALQRKLS